MSTSDEGLHHINQGRSLAFKVTGQQTNDAILVDVTIQKFKSLCKALLIQGRILNDVLRRCLKGGSGTAKDQLGLGCFGMGRGILGHNGVTLEKGDGQEIEIGGRELLTPLIEQGIVFSLIRVDVLGPWRKFGLGDAE